MDIGSLAQRLRGIADGPATRTVRVHCGDQDHQPRTIDVIGVAGSRIEQAPPLDCWFAKLGDLEDEATGAVTIDALNRAKRFRVLDAAATDLQWFLMSLASPVADRPYVGEVLATVHGLNNDDALAQLVATGGAAKNLVLAGLRSEGQAMDLSEMNDRLGAAGTMAWSIDAPQPIRATYVFGDNPSHPVLGESPPADIEFTFTHLTYLLRILTGEHSIMRGLERGTVKIHAEGAALNALMEVSAVLG